LIFMAAWWQRDWATLAGRERAGLAGNDITGPPRATLVAMATEETRRNVPTNVGLSVE
jgi:hypothetical protein